MKKAHILIILIGFAILIANFSPQLFLGRAFSNGDPLLTFYPAFNFYKQQINLHQSILWTRSILGGFPIYLDLLGGFYSPINFLLFKYFSVITAYNLALFVGIGLLFWCTYAFARELKLSRAGSLITAIAFSFGYHVTNWSNNLPVVNALFILPFVLLSISKLFSGSFKWIFFGGLGIGYALLTGQPQWVLMSFIAGGFYLLYLLWPALKKINWSLSFLRSLKPLFGFLIIILLGFIIASFQLLPAEKLALLSARSNGLNFHDAQVSAQTLFDWLWYILPDLQLRWLSGSEPTLYIGIIPLILGLIGLFSGIKKDARVKFPSFLWIFGLITALKFSPIFWLIHKLPIFSLFRGSNRWMFLGNFGLAILAGIGFDRIVDNEVGERIKNVSARIFSRMAVIVFSVVILANGVYFIFRDKIISWAFLYFKTHLYQNTTRLPLDYYLNYLKSIFADNFRSISLLNIRFILALVFLAIGVWFVRRLRTDDFAKSKYFIWTIVGLSAANLLVLHPNYFQTIPRRLIEEPPQTADIINARETGSGHLFRVLPVLSSIAMGQQLYTPHFREYTESDDVILGKDILEDNLGMLYGLDYIDGYENLMSRRIARIAAVLGSNRATMGDSLLYRRGNINDKLNEFVSRLPLISMLNIKYLISGFALPVTPGLKLVQTVISTRFDIPVYIYENSKVLPRIYLVNNVTILDNQNETSNFDIISRADNFDKTTFLECRGCQSQINYPNKTDSLAVQAYQDGLLELKVNTKHGRWLVFSESNLPGWHVTIDGNPTGIVTANYIFQSIYIPAGNHKVRMEYGGFKYGL